MVTSWLARPKSEVMSKLMRESERQLVAANCGWYPGSRKRQKRLMGPTCGQRELGRMHDIRVTFDEPRETLDAVGGR